VAIEAHPNTFRCLQRTSSLNRLQNVTLVQKAVGAKAGQSVITDQAAHEGNAIRSDGQGRTVEVESLDAILAPMNLCRIDLLKMNIEGAELEAIDGVKETICKTRHVSVACHDFLGKETKAKVREYLLRSGFEVCSREEEQRSFIRDIVYGSRKA
jgi:FkbM family methyltransferase